MDKIIFICYINRSGSTFLANLFSKSPDICVCPEADILVKLFLEDPYRISTVEKLTQTIDILTEDSKFKSWNLSKNDLRPILISQTNFSCFKQIVKCYQSITKPKSTSIVFKAERLIHLYPKLNKEDIIKWIALIRDPRAVYNSQKTTKHPDSEKFMAVNPLLIRYIWRRFFAKSFNYCNYHNFFILQFEELISNLVVQFNLLRKELKLLEFDIANTKGDLWDRLEKKYQLIHGGIQSPPQNSVISKWQNELLDSEVFEIQLANKKNLRKINYSIVPGNLNFLCFFAHFTGFLGHQINLFFKRILFRIKKLVE